MTPGIDSQACALTEDIPTNNLARLNIARGLEQVILLTD